VIVLTTLSGKVYSSSYLCATSVTCVPCFHFRVRFRINV